MDYIKEKHIICFNLLEIRDLFENTKKEEITKICLKKGISKLDLIEDKQKFQEIIYELVAKSKKSKEEIEFFVAIDACFNWYGGGNKKVCFDLKRNIQFDKILINNLDDLKKVIEVDTLTDFAIYYNGLRNFQLKQYQKKNRYTNIS